MNVVRDEKETAARLKVSPRSLQRWRVQGRGPKFIKIGKRVCYTDLDLDEYLDGLPRLQSTSEYKKPAA